LFEAQTTRAIVKTQKTHSILLAIPTLFKTNIQLLRTTNHTRYCKHAENNTENPSGNSNTV